MRFLRTSVLKKRRCTMLRETNTEYGRVRGVPAADPRITAFLGIPYAAPASGELRWRAPRPPKKWDGVRECFIYGDSAMQRRPGVGLNVNSQEWHVDPDLPMSEDCLNLNVWTPAMTGDEKLPVIIFIYGGALMWGYTPQMELDGERMARRGVVVVTVNYRVNIFGFFAHPELTAECGDDYCANFGFLDQQAAIAWVKRNIANFGGDPDNVTLAGQSAGAMSTMAQLVSPTTPDGSFHRAIIQSGGGMNFGEKARARFNSSLAQAEKEGEEFLQSIGCNSLAEARALSAEELRDRVFANLDRYHLGPCVDGKFLTAEPSACFASGNWHKMPLMVGNTGNDLDFRGGYFYGDTPEEFKEYIENTYGEKAEEIVKLADFVSGDMDVIRKNCLEKNAFFSCQLLALRAADEGLDAYVYTYDGEMPGDEQGAFHSSELWFMFETLAKCWRPFTGVHYDLARKMCSYWTNFVKNGDPNGKDIDGSDMPLWEKYNDENRRGIVFNFDTGMSKEDETAAFTAMLSHAADKLWREK